MLFVHNRETGKTKNINIGADGKSANGPSSSAPSLSADGRYIAFGSEANNLVAVGGTIAKQNAFVHDQKTGNTQIITVNSKGIPGNDGGCINPSISADGRYVAFETDANNLVPGDTNGKTDIFVHDNQE